MNYEEFKEKIQNELVDHMDDQYKGAKVVVKETQKVNKTVDGISLVGIPGHENASPSIAAQDVFKEYEKTGDFETVISNLADTFNEAIQGFEMPNIKNGLDFSHVDENIFFTLVNADQNKELLENVPHREFEDLAIVYRWNVGSSDSGMYTNIVNNDFMEKLGKSEEELFNLAKENTNRLFPVEVKDMNQVIGEMFFGDNVLDQDMRAEFEQIMLDTPDEKKMYVISNSARIYGAAAMLYEENLYELSQKLDSNLYILPSSVHECIAISDKFGEPEDLAQMVYEINMDQVELADRLSNQVYRYDKDARTLRLATDTINKSIDDQVADKNMVYETGKAR